MPYITPDARMGFVDVEQLNPPRTVGELNFVITEIALKFLAARGDSYATLNGIIGALECAKQEFYRRVAVPYEEKKRAENGAVSPEV